MLSLVGRRDLELEVQRKELRDELAFWKERTQSGGPLPQHNSQVSRVSQWLEVLLDATGSGASPGELAEAQGRVATVHAIWSFFRSALQLRESSWLKDHLLCADDLASECYRPAQERAVWPDPAAAQAVKEPPLVLFSA